MRGQHINIIIYFLILIYYYLKALYIRKLLLVQMCQIKVYFFVYIGNIGRLNHINTQIVIQVGERHVTTRPVGNYAR